MIEDNIVAQESPNEADNNATALQNKKEIVKQLSDLLGEGSAINKEQVDALKQSFYRLHNAEIENQKREFIAQGGEEQDFSAAADADEQEFKALLAKYKELRTAEVERVKQEREQHLLKRQAILTEMQSLAESETADVSGEMEHFHQLQQQWREAGQVDPKDEAELQKRYELYQNKFYDLVSINRELRDYDFRINLEAKTALCEKAEALADRKDIVPAFRDLLAYQEEWKNIGPVAGDQRESIWKRFREASTVIYKKHQDYFAEIHKREQANLEAKQALCDQVAAIKPDELTTAKMWDEATEHVNKIQEEWRRIGYAPRKDNQRIYDQYRELCDKFFEARNAYFRQIRDSLTANQEHKQRLIDRARSMKDSTDWNKTTQAFVALQNEWKTIGAVPRKVSNDLWQQFREACDEFFANKQAATAGQRAEEKQNLEAKKALLEKIEALEIGEKNATIKQLHELMGQYQSIGFVPFRDKDKLQKRYKAATDRIFDQLQVEESNRRIDTFNRNIEDAGEDKLLNERRRLLRQYDSLKAEIATAENNILFFTAKSHKSNSLLDTMQKNIELQKKQLGEIEKKINLIDEKLN